MLTEISILMLAEEQHSQDTLTVKHWKDSLTCYLICYAWYAAEGVRPQ